MSISLDLLTSQDCDKMNKITKLIYEADWEIHGSGLDDITDFYMIDEEETIKAIIIEICKNCVWRIEKQKLEKTLMNIEKFVQEVKEEFIATCEDDQNRIENIMDNFLRVLGVKSKGLKTPLNNGD